LIETIADHHGTFPDSTGNTTAGTARGVIPGEYMGYLIDTCIWVDVDYIDIPGLELKVYGE